MTNAIANIENRIDKDVTGAIAVTEGGISFRNATEVMEYAKMMAVSGSAVPKHLRGQPGACLGIIDDAIRFGISPYALARKSYFVNDNLAYEAQVIAAVMLKLAPLAERPDVSYKGEGDTRQCVITGKFVDGKVQVYESPKFSRITPKNSPLWKSDPDQQLAYYSLRAFGRRHCPDVILGMYDIEEMAAARARDVTPEGTGLAARLSGGTNGFNAENVDATLGATDKPEQAKEAEADQWPTEAETPVSEPDIFPGDLPSDGGDGIEARREGRRAFHAGEPRQAPDDYTESEKLAWLMAWDEESEALEAAQ